MKGLFAFGIVVASFTLFSCKKCQTCTTRVYQSYQGIQMEVSASSEEFCGDDYDSAPAEGTVQQSVAGAVQEVQISCVDS